MMLPGKATETVYRRPPDAVGAALGLEVFNFSAVAVEGFFSGLAMGSVLGYFERTFFYELVGLKS
jgi:hypothetical protein